MKNTNSVTPQINLMTVCNDCRSLTVCRPVRVARQRVMWCRDCVAENIAHRVSHLNWLRQQQQSVQSTQQWHLDASQVVLAG